MANGRNNPFINQRARTSVDGVPFIGSPEAGSAFYISIIKIIRICERTFGSAASNLFFLRRFFTLQSGFVFACFTVCERLVIYDLNADTSC